MTNLLFGDTLPHVIRPEKMPLGVVLRDVFQFMEAFSVRISEQKEVEAYYAFLEEEVLELKEAKTAEERLDALIDILYILAQLAVCDLTPGSLSELQPAFNNWVSVANQTSLKFNEEYDYLKAWDEVHTSNMSKLGEDGKPIYKNGKVQKGPNYKPPYLTNCILIS